jgi:ubiquitin carboxyl-terminal hydrolase 5/13
VKILEASQEPVKITKLAINVQGGADYSGEEWAFETQLKCLICCEPLETPADLVPLIDFMLQANSARFQTAVEGWEAELNSCHHTKSLVQQAVQILAKSLATCSRCELMGNLWLCLTCGSLGCGRSNYDGSGGNNHGVQHFEASGHPLVVKLGTITPEGTASVHCYVCSDEVIDECLAQHLRSFGISVLEQVKTEKTIAELELEANLNLTLSKAVEEGRVLTPRYGAGYTGLANLGNSCYINSVVQVLLTLPQFVQRYYADNAHLEHCPVAVNATCMQCQVAKLARGVLSGQYSVQRWTKPVETEPGQFTEPMEYQDGIKPYMFKQIIGKGHAEFSSAKQQDAYEYFTHLLTELERADKASREEFVGKIFEFYLTTRLQCSACRGVLYREDKTSSVSLSIPIDYALDSDDFRVNFKNCLDAFAEGTHVDLLCPRCKRSQIFSKTTRFATFPEVLVVVSQRFVAPNWVPVKLKCSLNVPETEVVLESLRHAEQAGEDKLEDAPEAGANEAFVIQIMEMGFSDTQARNALKATGNNSVEAASNWIFEHLDDPALNEAAMDTSGEVGMIQEMGFTAAQAKWALGKTDNSVERAIEYLFNHGDEMEVEQTQQRSDGAGRYKLHAFVTHIGASPHTGHYVAHVKKNDEWVLFNDNKVAATSDPPSGKAYFYFFTRTN